MKINGTGKLLVTSDQRKFTYSGCCKLLIKIIKIYKKEFDYVYGEGS